MRCLARVVGGVQRRLGSAQLVVSQGCGSQVINHEPQRATTKIANMHDRDRSIPDLEYSNIQVYRIQQRIRMAVACA